MPAHGLAVDARLGAGAHRRRHQRRRRRPLAHRRWAARRSHPGRRRLRALPHLVAGRRPPTGTSQTTFTFAPTIRSTSSRRSDNKVAWYVKGALPMGAMVTQPAQPVRARLRRGARRALLPAPQLRRRPRGWRDRRVRRPGRQRRLRRHQRLRRDRRHVLLGASERRRRRRYIRSLRWSARRIFVSACSWSWRMRSRDRLYLSPISLSVSSSSSSRPKR